jgi:cold shock CspA family protein
MSGEYFYGAKRNRAAVARVATISGPRHFRGTRTLGRVAKLATGKGFGFIRLTNEREVFFHRADLQEGTLFNDLNVGDTVILELFEDAVSGPRALHVARRR